MNTNESVVDRYLDGLGATLWGRSFNINDDRDEAIKFIVTLWRSLEDTEVSMFAEHDDYQKLLDLLDGEHDDAETR